MSSGSTEIDRAAGWRRAASAAALVLLSSAGAGAGQQAGPASPSSASSFTVFLRSIPIGSEQVVVERSAEGWTITSSGRTGAPIDVVARLVRARYTADWKPLELTIEGTEQGKPLTDQTTVSGVTATSVFSRLGQSVQQTDTIPADALLLPVPFWGPFEALSQRLKDAPAGSTLNTYDLQASTPIQVVTSGEETIDVGGRAIHARRTSIKFLIPAGTPLDGDVWGDDNGRLLRVSIPAESLEVVREDIASVAARRVMVSRAGDQPARITANGFSLAGTISTPAGPANSRWPAVVLVGGSGPADRDETVFGVPIFGELAGALADAGFLVLRYDKRGVGQSGGRAESATLGDYADDLGAVLKFINDRKDVDRKRIAVLGHGEGGSVAMLAAAKDDRIASVVLIAAVGVTGAEHNLNQVAHAVSRSNRSDADKQATIDLQKKIQRAVLTASGWEGIPAGVRRQAEVPWFQSFLAFDPSKPMSNMKQPILIVQGLLDTQVAPENADRLEALAKARKKGGSVDVVRVPDINHLLVPATTGEVDEYSALKDKHVSSMVTGAVSAWLQKTP